MVANIHSDTVNTFSQKIDTEYYPIQIGEENFQKPQIKTIVKTNTVFTEIHDTVFRFITDTRALKNCNENYLALVEKENIASKKVLKFLWMLICMSLIALFELILLIKRL